MIAIEVSQSINKMDSISIETQIEECEKELHKGEKASVYFDKGYSGKNTNRPEFQRMIKHRCQTRYPSADYLGWKIKQSHSHSSDERTY